MPTNPPARTWPILIAVLAVCLGGSPALASRNGAPARRTGSVGSSGQSCVTCHTGSLNFTTGSVQIIGAPTQYNPNRLYSISVRITDTVLAGAGFELSAESATGTAMGTLLISDSASTRFAANNPAYVTHTSSGVANSIAQWTANNRSATYAVRWRAPAAAVGSITFYAAGNAIDNNSQASNDRLYLANQVASSQVCDKGDVNGDESVDGADVNAFVAVLLASQDASAVAFCGADFNNDGVIDGSDVSALVNRLLNN